MIKKYLLSIFILLYTKANAGDNTLIIAAAEEPAPQEIVGTPIIRILFQKQENPHEFLSTIKRVKANSNLKKQTGQSRLTEKI